MDVDAFNRDKNCRSSSFLFSSVMKQLYQVTFFYQELKRLRKFYGKDGFWTWAVHRFKEHAVSDHRDDITH